MPSEMLVEKLKMVQSIIDRLSKFELIIKGWTITLVSALIALYIAQGKLLFLWIAILPIFCFWLLSSYYLWLERSFKNLFNDESLNSQESVDFRIDSKSYRSFGSFIKSIIAWHSLLLYTPMVILILIISLVD